MSLLTGPPWSSRWARATSRSVRSRFRAVLQATSSVALAVKNKDSFVSFIQYIDWLFYSDAGQEFSKWGVEGTTFTKEGGKRKLAAGINFQGLNPSGTKDLDRKS